MEWAEVINNPLLRNLPFKIELNKFGKLLMSPASNEHGRIQGQLSGLLWNSFPGGEIITECSVDTSDGVKVADVAWASAAFIAEFGYTTPYPKAPELCIEIEISEKVNLYLSKGAQEVWVVYENGKIETFSHIGQIPASRLAPEVQKKAAG